MMAPGNSGYSGHTDEKDSNDPSSSNCPTAIAAWRRKKHPHYALGFPTAATRHARPVILHMAISILLQKVIKI